MRVLYLSRFDRAFKSHDARSQKEIARSIETFLDNLAKGSRPQGLGLRRLQGPLWEFRVGLKYRVLFDLGRDTVTFAFVGNHDEVRRFLKSL